MAATRPFFLTQLLTDKRLPWSLDDAFNNRNPKKAVSALKMRINESPKADILGAVNIPTSKPFSRFLQIEDSVEFAWLNLGLLASEIAHRKMSNERYLKHFKILAPVKIKY